ncbi:MAG: S1-like domain-containing RNA-binding protein [Mucinivorans sp.]
MKINPGIINSLTIVRQSDNGLYLADTEGTEVLLPNRYIPTQATEGWAAGDTQNVFVYFDSEDRIVATTDTPKLMVGQIAALRVVSVTRIGAFMDWGLPKDLFVPFANQVVAMHTGEIHTVGAYVDNTTGRIVGSTKIGKYFNNDTITVRPGQEVSIFVAQDRDRGYRVVIDSRHWGMLYHNQIFQPVAIGDTLRAFVSKIAEDGRIDVSLQKQGFQQVQTACDVVFELLVDAGGRLELGDKSDPAMVQLHAGMSKKVFKRAVGFLMRQGKVRCGEFSTELISVDAPVEQGGDVGGDSAVQE